MLLEHAFHQARLNNALQWEHIYCMPKQALAAFLSMVKYTRANDPEMERKWLEIAKK